MELRFRSDDNKTSEGFSVSSSCNYFTEQVLRGGYVTNAIRIAELMRNPDSVELFQREIEKTRIREEIIAAEMIRKRTLEAELRREMTMERGLELHREEEFSLVSSSSSLSMWSEQRSSLLRNHHSDDSRVFDEGISFPSRQEVGNIENFPFQRHSDADKVTEINKGPVLFIAKPTNSNVSGIKRKVDTIGGAGLLALGNKKKKLQKEWTCDLCQVSVTSEQGLNDHVNGKKHRAKEAAKRAIGAASKDTSSSVTSQKKSDKPEEETEEISTGAKRNEEKNPLQVKKKGKALQKKQKQEVCKKKFKFWCEHCQIGCHSAAVMADHTGGKRHLAQVRTQNQDGGDVQTTTTSTTTTDNNTNNINSEASADKEAIEEANEEIMENVNGEVDGGEEGQEEEADTKQDLERE